MLIHHGSFKKERIMSYTIKYGDSLFVYDFLVFSEDEDFTSEFRKEAERRSISFEVCFERYQVGVHLMNPNVSYVVLDAREMDEEEYTSLYSSICEATSENARILLVTCPKYEKFILKHPLLLLAREKEIEGHRSFRDLVDLLTGDWTE